MYLQNICALSKRELQPKYRLIDEDDGVVTIKKVKWARDMIELKTWAGRSNFKYTGSVKSGTTIIYGTGRKVKVSTSHYSSLLIHFSKNTVDIGTSRDNPPKGSLGEWLQQNVTKTAIASYVGPILIHEGYAEKVVWRRSQIKVNCPESQNLVYGSFNDFEVIFLPIETAKYYAKFHSAHDDGVTFGELYEVFPEFFCQILEYFYHYHYELWPPSFKNYSCRQYYIELFKQLYDDFGNGAEWIGLSKIERPFLSFVDFTNYYQNELSFKERIPLANDKFNSENIDFEMLLEICNPVPRMDWAPKVILDKFRYDYESIHDGSFTVFEIDNEAEIRMAFEEIGYTCHRDEILIAKAHGQ